MHHYFIFNSVLYNPKWVSYNFLKNYIIYSNEVVGTIKRNRNILSYQFCYFHLCTQAIVVNFFLNRGTFYGQTLRTLHGNPNLRVLITPQQPILDKFRVSLMVGFERPYTTYQNHTSQSILLKCLLNSRQLQSTLLKCLLKMLQILFIILKRF